METVDFIDILNHAARLAGLEPDTAAVEEFADFRLLIGDRLETACDRTDWVDLWRCEKRYFRQAYASASTYTAGDERYHHGSQENYQALRAVPAGQAPATFAGGTWTINLAYWAVCSEFETADDYDSTHAYLQGEKARDPSTGLIYQLFTATSTGNAPTDATNWGALAEFNRYVAFAQTGQTAFDLAEAWNSNPRKDGRATTYTQTMTQDGLQVLDDVPYCWLEFRLRKPVLKGDNFDAAATYAVGDQFYYQSATKRGNLWNVITATAAGEDPDDTPAKFTQVEIPKVFKSYLIHGAAGDYHTPDGDEEIAKGERKLAEQRLEEQVQINEQRKPNLHRTEVFVR